MDSCHADHLGRSQEESNSLRHAEKRRVSSCVLSDRVAAMAISAYRSRCPASLLEAWDRGQTVLAALVLHESSELRVASLGVGTKTLGSSRMGDRMRRVRDCHAEVLAKRAFQRFLYDETLAAMKLGDEYAGCLERSMTSGDIKLRLKEGVAVYLYTSSQPCGNATIKKWAKSKKPQTFPEADPDEIPLPLKTHPRLEITARSDGQVSLLLKRDPEATHNIDEKVPAGMDGIDVEASTIKSCSDKIALWNAVGLQGALLSHIMFPVYLTAIVVGRKFSDSHCRRALCCRLQDFEPVTNGLEVYSIHHPAMLSTSVVFDTKTICTETSSGARFLEWKGFGWWPGGLTIVDSRTGLEASEDEMMSPLCSLKLFEKYLEVLEADPYTRKISTNLFEGGLESRGLYAEHKARKFVTSPSSLYWEAKERICSDPKLFGGWKRKSRLPGT